MDVYKKIALALGALVLVLTIISISSIQGCNSQKRISTGAIKEASTMAGLVKDLSEPIGGLTANYSQLIDLIGQLEENQRKAGRVFEDLTITLAERSIIDRQLANGIGRLSESIAGTGATARAIADDIGSFIPDTEGPATETITGNDISSGH